MTTVFAVAFGMMTSSALAAGSFNPDPASNGVGILSVAVGQTSQMGNLSSVTAQPGDIVSLNIYYHNNGNTGISNTRIKFNPTSTGSGTSHVFTGSISGDGATTITDTVSVSLPSNQTITFIPGSVKWFPNQSGATGNYTSLTSSQENDLVGGSGFNIGTLTPGWSSQGGIVAKFQVSSKNNSDTQIESDPNVVTYAPTGLSDTSGSATLKGFVDPRGGNVTAWFQYRRNDGAWVETPHQSVSSAQNMSRSLTGLYSGNYEYKAVAKNSASNVNIYGESKYFTIHGNNVPSCDPCDPCGNNYPCGTDNQNDPSVETLTPTNIDQDSATLRGNLLDDGNDSNDVYFEWGTSSGNLSRTLNVGTRSNTGTFSKTLSGLSDNTRYYYRACAENSSGTDCGDIESFRTDSDTYDYCDYADCDNSNDRPNVTTLNAYSIGSTTAVVDGYFTSNGCSTTTYFEYGRTNNLGSTTASVNRGNNSGSMAYGFTSLAPNTTYYYRAVASNCEGTTRGAIKSFTTRTGTVIVNPVTPTTVYTGTGGGTQFIKLTIDNNRGTVRSGTDIVYDLTWENVTRSTIKGLILEVNFDDMVALDTDMGNIARDGHSVIVELDDLGPLESGEMSITTKTSGNLKEGDPVVAQAIMAFENPKTSASENAIAYDSDEFTNRGSTLGASIFGLGLPTTLGGWLFILLIIILIVVLARHFARQNQVNTIATGPAPMAPQPEQANDYIVYRPTPKV